MVEVKKETIFNKLKTEIISLKKDQFVDFIHEIMAEIENGKDMTTSISLLTTCFKDDCLIENLINQGFCDDWQEKTADVYKQLVSVRQIEFMKSINKKFETKILEYKEPMIDKDKYEFVEKKLLIDEIIVPNKFKDALPAPRKLFEIYKYYRDYESFPTKIVVNCNNVLQSGYTVYLLCRLLDKKDIVCYNTVNK